MVQRRCPVVVEGMRGDTASPPRIPSTRAPFFASFPKARRGADVVSGRGRLASSTPEASVEHKLIVRQDAGVSSMVPSIGTAE